MFDDEDMVSVREFARDHKYGPLEPLKVGGGLKDSDPYVNSAWLERGYAAAQVTADNADLFAIQHAYGRDSYGRDPLSESNYAYLETNYEDYLIRVSYVNVDQWAIRADAEIPESLAEILAGLEDYPVIDEGDMSQLEWDLMAEDWEDWGRDEFRQEIANAHYVILYGQLPYAGPRAQTGRADLDDTGVGALSDSDLDDLWHKAEESGAVQTYYETGGGTVYDGLKAYAGEVAKTL
jgi:hypothetical protein